MNDMANFPLTFTIVGVLCLITAAIIAALNPPAKIAELVPVRA